MLSYVFQKKIDVSFKHLQNNRPGVVLKSVPSTPHSNPSFPEFQFASCLSPGTTSFFFTICVQRF